MGNQRQQQKEQTRQRILEAMERELMEKGFHATSLDRVCKGAGVTKGALFHHFKNKEELARESASAFVARMQEKTGSAPFMELEDPRERVFGYVDFIIAIHEQSEQAYGCILGTLAQEIHLSHPQLNAHCQSCFEVWVEGIEALLSEAKEAYVPEKSWSPHGVAQHYLAVFQGATVLSKAQGDPAVVAEHLRHFKDYLRALFAMPSND